MINVKNMNLNELVIYLFAYGILTWYLSSNNDHGNRVHTIGDTFLLVERLEFSW